MSVPCCAFEASTTGQRQQRAKVHCDFRYTLDSNENLTPSQSLDSVASPNLMMNTIVTLVFHLAYPPLVCLRQDESGVRRTSGGDEFIVELEGTRSISGDIVDNLDGMPESQFVSFVCSVCVRRPCAATAPG